MVENRELNIKNIDAYYDLFDKACMTLIEKGNKRSYLDAFNAFANYIDDGINSFGLDNRTINSLNRVIDKICELEILNEEVREALMLLVIKGLKHSLLNLDYITPDIIVYLYSHIIDSLFPDRDLTILDTGVGMGIMMNGILNNLDKNIDYLGLEKDEVAIKVASSVTNLCMNEARLYANDAMDELINAFSNITLIDSMRVDDIYKTILKYNNLSDYSICLIDNDFFSNPKSVEFKKEFSGTLLGLICLPNNLFKSGKEKSILLISNKSLSNYDISVIQIPELSDKEKLVKVIGQMNAWLNNISYKNIYND